MAYHFLPHTADIRAAIEAPSLQAVLTDAVRLVRVLCVGESPVDTAEERGIAVTGGDAAEVLYYLLRELLYHFAADRFVPAVARFDQVTPTGAVARVAGERFDPDKHEVQPEVKAVTRHGLFLDEIEQGWRAEVVFDV